MCSAQKQIRPPSPRRACQEDKRSRQQSPYVTKDSTFGLVQGGRVQLKIDTAWLWGWGGSHTTPTELRGLGRGAALPDTPPAPEPLSQRLLGASPLGGGENVCKMLGTQWGLNEHRLLSLLVSIFFLVKIPNFIAMPFLAS